MYVKVTKCFIVIIVLSGMLRCNCINTHAETIKKYDMNQYDADVYNLYSSVYENTWLNQLSVSENIDYCKMLDNMDSVSEGINIGSQILGEELSVTKYLEILTKLIGIMDLELKEYINQQSTIDSLKTIDDYVMDVVDIISSASTIDKSHSENIADDICKQLQYISDAIGIDIEAIELTVDSLDRVKLYQKVLQEYSYYNSFLDAIIENTNQSELKEAAQILKKNMNALLGLKVIQISDTAEDVSELFGKDIFLDTIVPELLNQERELDVLEIELDSIDYECLEMLNTVYTNLSNSGELSFKLLMFGGDMLFGTTNMYIRYNEMLTMKYIRDALNTKISLLNQSITNQNQNEQIQEITSLMNSVVYVDCRGYYSLFSIIENDGQLLSLIHFNDYQNYEEWYESVQKLSENQVDNIQSVFPNIENYIIEEYIEKKIDLTEYLDDIEEFHQIVGGYESEETGDHEKWFIGQNIQYGNYVGNTSVDDVTNNNENYQLFGVGINDEIQEAESKLLQQGWQEEQQKETFIEFSKDKMHMNLHFDNAITSISFYRDMWTEVQTDEQDETMKKSEEEVYDLLVKHYEEIKNNGEVDSSAVVMTGSMENDRQYFTMVRCGVPGNPSASQLLYSVIVDVYTGEVIQTRELTDGKVETFYLW